MKFMIRLLLMLAVLILGLAIVATRSTAEESVPWAPECFECSPTLNGDPDGGSGQIGPPRENESYRVRVTAPRHSGQLRMPSTLWRRAFAVRWRIWFTR